MRTFQVMRENAAISLFILTGGVVAFRQVTLAAKPANLSCWDIALERRRTIPVHAKTKLGWSCLPWPCPPGRYASMVIPFAMLSRGLTLRAFAQAIRHLFDWEENCQRQQQPALLSPTWNLWSPSGLAQRKLYKMRRAAVLALGDMAWSGGGPLGAVSWQKDIRHESEHTCQR
jgi:hypothetical protein